MQRRPDNTSASNSAQGGEPPVPAQTAAPFSKPVISVLNGNPSFRADELEEWNLTSSECSSCLVVVPHSQLYVCLRNTCPYTLKQRVSIRTPGQFYNAEKVFCGRCAFRGCHKGHLKNMDAAEPLAILTATNEVAEEMREMCETLAFVNNEEPVDYMMTNVFGCPQLPLLPAFEYLAASKNCAEWLKKKQMLDDVNSLIRNCRRRGHEFAVEMAREALEAYKKMNDEVTNDLNVVKPELDKEEKARLREHKERMRSPPRRHGRPSTPFSPPSIVSQVIPEDSTTTSPAVPAPSIANPENLEEELPTLPVIPQQVTDEQETPRESSTPMPPTIETPSNVNQSNQGDTVTTSPPKTPIVLQENQRDSSSSSTSPPSPIPVVQGIKKETVPSTFSPPLIPTVITRGSQEETSSSSTSLPVTPNRDSVPKIDESVVKMLCSSLVLRFDTIRDSMNLEVALQDVSTTLRDKTGNEADKRAAALMFREKTKFALYYPRELAKHCRAARRLDKALPFHLKTVEIREGTVKFDEKLEWKFYKRNYGNKFECVLPSGRRVVEDAFSFKKWQWSMVSLLDYYLNRPGSTLGTLKVLGKPMCPVPLFGRVTIRKLVIGLHSSTGPGHGEDDKFMCWYLEGLREHRFEEMEVYNRDIWTRVFDQVKNMHIKYLYVATKKIENDDLLKLRHGKMKIGEIKMRSDGMHFVKCCKYLLFDNPNFVGEYLFECRPHAELNIVQLVSSLRQKLGVEHVYDGKKGLLSKTLGNGRQFVIACTITRLRSSTKGGIQFAAYFKDEEPMTPANKISVRVRLHRRLNDWQRFTNIWLNNRIHHSDPPTFGYDPDTGLRRWLPLVHRIHVPLLTSIVSFLATRLVFSVSRLPFPSRTVSLLTSTLLSATFTFSLCYDWPLREERSDTDTDAWDIGMNLIN